MPERESVQRLVESKLGLYLDVGRLSPKLNARLEQLQAMNLHLDLLDVQIVKLDHKARVDLLALGCTLVFGMVGLALGLLGYFQGYLSATGATPAWAASGIVLIGDYWVISALRKTQRLRRLKVEERLDFASELEAGLGSAYRAVLEELSTLNRF